MTSNTVLDSDWIDAIGHRHQAADKEACRIVSVVPSITELLIDLGLTQHLVGRTGFCIHPVEIVAHIAKVGGTKDINVEKIRRLAPTHLVVNIDENKKEVVEQIAEFVPHVIVTHPNHPHDNFHLYRLLGNIFSAQERSEHLCSELTGALARIESLPKQARTVLYCIWKDPWMSISSETYIAAMLALRGWQVPVLEQGSRRYPEFAWDKETLSTIDQVFLSTEPYRFDANHCVVLAEQIKKPVQLIDGEMLSWYGSRAIAGINYLADLPV